MVAFKLPWPVHELSQNARGHWATLAPARKKARAVAKRKCKEALLGGKLKRGDTLRVTITFHPPELKRRRDLQNLIGSLKYGVDGIADAVGLDDSVFELTFGWGPVLDVNGYVGVVLS